MTYAIANWDEIYENASTRKLRYLHWVPVPNKQDGRAYCSIMAEPDGLAILGAWLALLETASKMPRRGVLADSRGPLSVRDIAVRTRASMAGIQRALEVLCSPEIGWITANPENSSLADFPPQLADSTRNPPFAQIPSSVTKASQFAQTGRLADFGVSLGESANGEPKSPKIDPEIEQNRTEQNRTERERNVERASGRSTALGERPPARPLIPSPSREGASAETVTTGPSRKLATQQAVTTEDLSRKSDTQAVRIEELAQAARSAIRSIRGPDGGARWHCDLDLARRIATAAVGAFSEITPEQLARVIPLAQRARQREATLFERTVPEAIEARTEGGVLVLETSEERRPPAIACDKCGDRGYVPRVEGRFWPDSSAIAGAIDRGEARLCECEAGEGWQALFANLAAPMVAKDGRKVQTGFRAPGSVAV